jgi:NAD(P)-dependent dehydrogenase (short-subunit alcohol dehydrogenase family)
VLLVRLYTLVPAHRINNAGTNAYKYGPLLDSDDEDLEAIVDTNVLGVMLCCKEVGGFFVCVCVCVCVGGGSSILVALLLGVELCLESCCIAS